MTITYATAFCFFGGVLLGIGIKALHDFINAELKELKEMNDLTW
ncbi:hypothetical protein [Rhodopseudomonas palustris]|nr:hypothetical protein [Rhodopseudomonas palustris]